VIAGRIRTGRELRARAIIAVALANLRTSHRERNRVMAEGSIAAAELRLLIERVERLEEEKKAMSDDIKDVFAEAKARGYDPKTMRAVIRLRKMETHQRQEAEALLDVYKAALGMDGSSIGPRVRQAEDKTPIEEAVEKTAEAVNKGALGPGVTAAVVH
jgi:uncharacterized protein (UPF0335 family)